MMVWKHLAFAALFLPSTAVADDVLVFAAASLKGPLDQVVAEFPGVRVSYGGSGTLARQIQQGAPADVVLLAHADWMDVLVDGGHVASPAVFARNRLVLVGQPGAAELDLAETDLLEALDGGRLAIGFSASVPAGIYARQALMSLGLWEALQPHLAEVDNVRAALALVARGEAPLGIVYASDVLVVPELTLVAEFPETSHDPIAYWAGVVAGSDNPAAMELLAALVGADAQEALARAGFCALAAPCEAP